MNYPFPHDWRLIPLEEAMSAIIDYRGKSPVKTSFGVPLVTAKIVKGGRILDPDEYISEDDYESWMRRGLPEPGDVLITTEAPLGEVAQLGTERVALAQRLIGLRGKPGVVDNTYLKFALQSGSVREQILSRATGTTVTGIRQSELRRVLLPLPPFAEQQSLALILGTMDEKIELNHRMNETLEAIARTIFKSWFVDFDSVSGGHPLFPRTFDSAPLGQVPQGWKVGTLGDIAENPRRGVAPADVSAGTAYIGLEHMPRRSIALDQWGEVEGLESQKFRFFRREILFGKLRPYFHKVGVAAVDGICSTDILVVVPRQDVYLGFVLALVSSEEFVQYTDRGSAGTKMPRTNWSDMARYRIVIPPEPVAGAFNEIVKPMIEKIAANIHESRTLAALRDALLPKLLSGEIRVKQAEKIVGEAV